MKNFMKGMGIIMLVLVVFGCMGGCTKYVVDKELRPDGSSSTHVSATSTRDLEQPELSYERMGNDAKFNFKAAGVDNNTDAYLGMFQGMMGMMMGYMEKMLEMQIPVPSPEPGGTQ